MRLALKVIMQNDGDLLEVILLYPPYLETISSIWTWGRSM